MRRITKKLFRESRVKSTYDEENKNVAMTAMSLGGDATTVLEQDDTTTNYNW